MGHVVSRPFKAGVGEKPNTPKPSPPQMGYDSFLGIKPTNPKPQPKPSPAQGSAASKKT